MTFRWYGEGNDSITPQQIKQIPGMTGLMGVLDYKAAGEVWTEDEIKAYVDEVHAAGLECEVIESVNVHEDIKMGLPTRDEYIANYITTIRNLAKYGIKVIVDVVPNHTTPDLDSVSESLISAAGGREKLYHANGFNEIVQWDDRLECTTGRDGGPAGREHGESGLPGLLHRLPQRVHRLRRGRLPLRHRQAHRPARRPEGPQRGGEQLLAAGHRGDR